MARPEARTVRLDTAPEPASFAGQGVTWLEPGLSLSGLDCLEVALPADSNAAERAKLVAEALNDFEIFDEVGQPGTGPLAIISAPFAPNAPAIARIPRSILGTDHDGTRWHTTISGSRAHENAGPRPAGAAPASYRVHAARLPAEWMDAVATVRDEIREGSLTKAVLAREVLVEADGPISIPDVIDRLSAAYPSTMRWHVDGFVGASPELLVSVRGDRVASHPLAGTAPRKGDPSADARLAADLLASEKNRWEHQITIDALLDTLIGYCSYLDTEAEPSVVAVANVQHLGTRVRGHLSSPPASAVELAFDLHPTPAVGGQPRAEALDAIRRLEHMDRGRYAGPTGWVDRHGDGTFAVAIRSAEIAGATARLFAGNGMVADSDPDAEYAETQAKLQALLGAIVRP